MANEFAHFLLNSPATFKVRVWIKNHKKAAIISVVSLILIVAGIILAINIAQSKSYYKEYHVTDGGEKYHEEDCIFVKDKTNTRRLTEKEYDSGEYESCQICLPD